MSFYGNITNTSRTHFQFDRIYASRKEMESHKSEDGIYAGRFVLVEYDNQMHMDSFLRISKIENINNTKEYYAVLEQKTSEGDSKYQEVKLTRDNIHKGAIVYTSAYEENSAGGHFVKNCVFYKCTSDYEKDSVELATFEEVVNEQQFIYLGKIDECVFQNNLFYTKENNEYIPATTWSANATYYILSNYITNHALDVKCYGRGYDSTVWQKVYIGGQEKYIMIAELNAIVPSFDIEADAPTQSPIAPHFDLESSDLYYKLHYQPSWGLRVKGARVERGSKIDREGNEISNTNIDYMVAGKQFVKIGSIEENEFNSNIYYIRNNNNFTIAEEWDGNVEYYILTHIPLESKSDETTIWNRVKYDPKTGVAHTLYWHSTEANENNTGNWQERPPVAPENEAQDDERTPAAIYYNKAGFKSDVETTDYGIKDCITLTPSGQSGQEYNIHDGATHYFDAAPDIQELSIMLPSLGNSVAEMWNIIYGEGQQDNNNQRNKDISWNSKNGLRMVHPIENGYTYSPVESETLAGVINSVHDLMGMIIVDTQEPITPDSASNDKIYYYDGKFYKRHTSYDYIPIGYTKIGLIEEGNFNNQLYIQQNGDYVKANEWSATTEYYTKDSQVPGNMQYVEVDWAFDSFPADKYFYGGALTQDSSSIYHLETNNYPTYGYNYQTTTNEDESFFNKIILSNYDSNEYYRIGNVVLREQTEGQNSISGQGYINGDEVPDPSIEYSKINIIPIDTYTVNGKTPLENKKPYVSDAYYIYPLETPILDPETNKYITTKQIMPGDDPTKIIKADSDHIYNEKNFYYLPKVIEGNDLLFDLQQTFNPQTAEYVNKLYYSTTEHKNNKLISCYTLGSTNNSFYIPPSILSDDTFEFFIVEEAEKTKHFYRPRAYYTVTAEEEREGQEEKIATEYTLSIATQSDDQKEYYELNKEAIKTISLNPQDYIKPNWPAHPRYYVNYSYYYQLDNGQYVIDRENVISNERYKEVQNMDSDKFNNGIYYILNNENKYEKATEYNESQKYWSLDYFIRENVLYVKEDKNKFFGIGSEWNPNVTTIPEDVTLATRIPVAEMQELKGFADTLNTIHGLILKINNILLTDDAYTRDNATVQGCINLMNDIIQRFEIIEPGQIMLVDDYGRVHSAPMTGDDWINIDIDDNAVEPTINISHKITPVNNTVSGIETENRINEPDQNTSMIGQINLYTPHVDRKGHIVGENIETIELPHGFKTFVPETRYVGATSGKKYALIDIVSEEEFQYYKEIYTLYNKNFERIENWNEETQYFILRESIRNEDKEKVKYAYKQNINAENHIDTLVLKTGSNSLNWEYDEDGDDNDQRKTLRIMHIAPQPLIEGLESNTQILSYGDPCDIDTILPIDTTGHIKAGGKLLLPGFTREEGDSGEIITNIDSNGKLQTLNIIDLTLTGYSKLSSADIPSGSKTLTAIPNGKEIISSTDSIQATLAKLESAIYTLQKKNSLV